MSGVIPLYQDDDHEITSNNRPPSLLEVFIRNNRLSQHQKVNRKHHSTESLNILISDIMLKAMDKKHVTTLRLLDLSKEFDSVNHTISLHKLRSVGASPQTVKRFENYLSGRSQYVRIRSTVSSFGS